MDTMTDKDPKDMTASELLRWAARDYMVDHSYCEMALNEALCHGSRECYLREESIAALADKIDAELAQVRAADLRDLAAIWAVTNGWPDFREGEVFGAWLDRCALMRPRYDNGDPVDMEDFGDPESDDFAWYTVSDSGDWTIYAPAISPDPIEGDISERVKRHAPDTQERIDEDANKSTSEYWGCAGIDCDSCPALVDLETPSERYNTGGCQRAMVLDLLRRQRELDKRTGGAE